MRDFSQSKLGKQKVVSCGYAFADAVAPPQLSLSVLRI